MANKRISLIFDRGLAFCLVLVFAQFSGFGVLAQSGTSSALVGTVTDSSGAVVPGAAVTAIDTGPRLFEAAKPMLTDGTSFLR